MLTLGTVLLSSLVVSPQRSFGTAPSDGPLAGAERATGECLFDGQTYGFRFELELAPNAKRVGVLSVSSSSAGAGAGSSQVGKVLWAAADQSGIHDRLACKVGEDGRWLTAGTIAIPGAYRSLSLWTGNVASLLSRESAVPGSISRLTDVPKDVRWRRFDSVSVQNVLDPASNKPASVSDLCLPDVFTWGKDLYLVYSTGQLNMTGKVPGIQNTDRLICISAVKEMIADTGDLRPDLRGTFAVVGLSPRVLVDSGGTVLLVAREAPFVEDEGEYPLRVYRSRDLARWEIDADMSRELKASANYDMAATGTKLWLTYSSERDNRASIVFRSFDMSKREWTTSGSFLPETDQMASRRAELRLGLTPAGLPTVTYRNKEGRLVTRTP